MKPALLYASPFEPWRSGISTYSSSLVQALRQYFDITLLLGQDDFQDAALADLPRIRWRENAEYRDFSHILYNFGNQPDYHGYMVRAIRKNPGWIIMHDLSLYYLMVGEAQRDNCVMQMIYREAGPEGIALVKESAKKNPEPNLLAHKDLSSLLPLNREVIKNACGVLTHSKYASDAVLKTVPDKKVETISLLKMALAPCSYEDSLKGCSDLWGIPKDAYVVVSAGYIANTKRNLLVSRAVNLYNARHEDKIYYLMAGEGKEADSELNQYCRKTGYIDDKQYSLALNRADLVVNLRYPTNGETSATLIQAMQLAKPSVVTDIAWFSEIPDWAVIKTKQELTVEGMAYILKQAKKGFYNGLGERGKQYVDQECAPEKIAERIYHILIAESK